jgi:hypothetical protein
MTMDKATEIFYRGIKVGISNEKISCYNGGGQSAIL